MCNRPVVAVPARVDLSRVADAETEQEPIVVTTWGAWQATHPGTAVVSADAGTGRVYVPDPLSGTPVVVPAVPVGSVDPTLEVETEVLGVDGRDGTRVAFDADLARAQLDLGEHPTAAGVRLERHAGGLVAVEARSGRRLPARLAYWFAWSSTYPDTRVWPDP